MKQMVRFFFLVILVSVLSCTADVRAEEESFFFGPFGRVFVYEGQAHPAGVILFISGDGGWNKGVVDMARELSRLGPLVVGVDITRYLRNRTLSDGACSYPAADFEALSKYVQKTRNYPQYMPPILVGYSSGAALVYAVLAQAPPNTFRGGISLGFCPELKFQKPLCRGQGLDSKPGRLGTEELFLPDKKLETPWIVLQGAIDEVCNADKARTFVRMVPEADFVLLRKVGHGFSVKRNWMPEFKQAFERLKERGEANTVNISLKDLPLVEVLAQGKDSDYFAVIISGDGGWAGLDREVAGALVQRGIPVVGLNSLRYFWTKRTPDGASEDLARILRHYRDAWSKHNVLLVGYSLGADVLPFMANRLPAELLDHVRAIVLLGPGKKTDFEFRLSEWLPGSEDAATKPLLPEIEKLRNQKVLCMYGSEEKDSLCPELGHDLAESVRMPGGHHFNGKYESIAGMILDRVTKK
jgi:type IV secretory pathway VirJ component